jgi:hypothetical protein
VGPSLKAEEEEEEEEEDDVEEEEENFLTFCFCALFDPTEPDSELEFVDVIMVCWAWFGSFMPLMVAMIGTSFCT